jgi:hypothetical protein
MFDSCSERIADIVFWWTTLIVLTGTPSFARVTTSAPMSTGA